jgi:hypothetical protein
MGPRSDPMPCLLVRPRRSKCPKWLGVDATEVCFGSEADITNVRFPDFGRFVPAWIVASMDGRVP